jgi:hypothetical protein
MIIAVVGYFTVPSVASYIVHPSGRDSLLSKSSDTLKKGGDKAKSAAKTAAMIATGI